MSGQTLRDSYFSDQKERRKNWKNVDFPNGFNHQKYFQNR